MYHCKVIRYSEAFKLQIIKEFEEGDLSIWELGAKYGIKGTTTIRRWVEKYNKTHLLNKIIRVEKPDEKKELDKLKAENQKLKNALADAHIRQVTAESFLEAACEMFGITLEEAKKKFGKQ